MIDLEVFQSYRQVCKLMKEPFEVIMSNYTLKIVSEKIKYSSMEDEKSRKFFIASAKVKKDCLLKPCPVIDKSEIKFFAFNLPTGVKYDNIYGIDLKNAYATILKKEGFISSKTFGYLSSLPKLDRLGSLGMLAGKKQVISFDENGEEVKNETKIKDTENYFFFAVQRTGEIMEQMKKLVGSDYLFTWVDCIYFRSEKNIQICAEFLTDNDFQFHEKRYKRLETKETKKGDTLRVTMWEQKEDGSEVLKLFHAPTKKKKILNDLSLIIDKFATNQKK